MRNFVKIGFLLVVTANSFAFELIEAHPGEKCSEITRKQKDFDGSIPKVGPILDKKKTYFIKRNIFSNINEVFYQCEKEFVTGYSYDVQFHTYEEAREAYIKWVELGTKRFGPPKKIIDETQPIKIWAITDNETLLGISLDNFNEEWSVRWSW